VKKKTTRNAVEILHKRYIKNNPKRLKSLQRERTASLVAEQIYEIRTKLGMTQEQFARLTGMKQSVISRLEDADYNGYSLKTLEKIASSVKCHLEVNFVSDSLELCLST